MTCYARKWQSATGRRKVGAGNVAKEGGFPAREISWKACVMKGKPKYSTLVSLPGPLDVTAGTQFVWPWLCTGDVGREVEAQAKKGRVLRGFFLPPRPSLIARSSELAMPQLPDGATVPRLGGRRSAPPRKKTSPTASFPWYFLAALFLTSPFPSRECQRAVTLVEVRSPYHRTPRSTLPPMPMQR